MLPSSPTLSIKFTYFRQEAPTVPVLRSVASLYAGLKTKRRRRRRLVKFLPEGNPPTELSAPDQ